MAISNISSTTPNYTIDDIVRSTQPDSQPGGFRRVLGSIAGAATNVVAPGLGSVVGSAISGGAAGATTPGDQWAMFQVMTEIQRESRLFEMQSNIAKARHDAAMSAVRNIK